MRLSNTQRLTAEVETLIRKVGDDVIVRHGGKDYGMLVAGRINAHPDYVATFEGQQFRRTDCRIRKSTVRTLRRLAAAKLVSWVASHEHRADVMANGSVRIAIVECKDGQTVGHSIDYAANYREARAILGY